MGVREKSMTDQEIEAIYINSGATPISFARAVIAADRQARQWPAIVTSVEIPCPTCKSITIVKITGAIPPPAEEDRTITVYASHHAIATVPAARQAPEGDRDSPVVAD